MNAAIYVSTKLFVMKIFRASTHIEEGTVELRLNNRVISNRQRISEESLIKGDYIVEWFAEGKAFGSFGITISSPLTAEFQLTRRLDSTGRDFGGFKFTV